MNVIDKLLHNYENSSYVVQLKAHFLLYLCILILSIIPFSTTYAVILEIRKPDFNYSNPGAMVIGLIVIGLIIFVIMLGLTVFLLRGKYPLSSHLVIIFTFIALWATIFIDSADTISRLDTIVLVLATLTATPILAFNKKPYILLYAAINLGILCAYLFYFRDTFPIPDGSFYDYFADTMLAFIFIAIVSYNILSINNRALEQSEISNNALTRSNEELQSAMEELTAANEEFEAQNEELMRSEEALRFSEAELLSIFNSAHDAMIIFDLDGRILDVNERMLEMYGVDRARALSLSIGELSAQDLDTADIKDNIGTMTMDKSLLYEWKARRLADNVQFDVEAGVRRLRRRGKDVILAVVRDISDRKKAEEKIRESLNEKIVLIKEIHHRVKNNMQVISSLLNMQADTMKEPLAHEALKDAIGRIHSMASIHERVYSTESFSRVDMAAYVDELSRDLVLLHSNSSGHVQINHQAKPVFLDINRAIPCGLLINEILTNAIKHGRSESKPCSIDLSIEESDGRITLVIADNGPGMEPELFMAERKTSMGMQIIDALARQINATLTLDVNHGTRITIRMPIEG